ncbi:MAG: hypothetical protein ACRDYF_01755, partial [Acidimicrobiia bacterium]
MAAPSSTTTFSPCRSPGAFDLHVREDVSGHQLDGRVVAQHLLDGRVHEAGIGPQPVHLGAMAKQSQQPVADQIGGRDDAGSDQQADRGRQLGRGEAAAVVPFHQERQDVVARTASPRGHEVED